MWLRTPRWAASSWAGERFGLAHLKWGLVPDWSDNPDRGLRPINARDDSMGKPMFARLFATQRCLLPATGFYEWRVTGKRKEPVHFSLTAGGLMAFAGLWSVWNDGRRKVITCCLITTEPNELVRDYHDRMPAIIPPDLYWAWLDNDTPQRELKAMLKPFPAEGMTARLANPVLNKAKGERPECLAVAEAEHPTPRSESASIGRPAGPFTPCQACRHCRRRKIAPAACDSSATSRRGGEGEVPEHEQVRPPRDRARREGATAAQADAGAGRYRREAGWSPLAPILFNWRASFPPIRAATTGQSPVPSTGAVTLQVSAVTREGEQPCR
jgi:putative SOS response-associated peptidase YedK